ncbi:MAG: MFS transporter [Rhodospirillales bacterium]|jgi:MFS family permease|nr:MFS transporter [Rhodospirillales bacterium]
MDTPKSDGENRPIRFLPWLIWFLAALFYGYGYFQRVATSVMVEDLMHDFAVGAAVLGNLSAIYYYAYASLQIPVGVLNDRFGPRRILTAAAFLGGSGAVIFSFAPTIEMAYTGRLLVGIGVAFAWVSSLKLIGIWFAPHRFATMTGLTLVVGMAGGILAQAPLALAIAEYGWRTSLAASSTAAFILAAAIWFVVRDARTDVAETPKTRLADVLRGALPVLASRQTWCVALFGMSTTVVALGFMALWGVPFLSETYGLDRPSAASVISVGFVGQAFGGVFLGWLSDTIRLRKPPMIGSLIVMMGLFVLVVYGPTLPLLILNVAMFVMGATSAASIVGFAAVREHAPSAVSGVTVACVNTFLISSGAIMQPVAGWILDLYWDGTLIEGVRVYGLDVWMLAFAPFVAFCTVGLAGSLFIRETHCRPLEEGDAR